MAVGDMVTFQSAINTLVQYQPAAGVEIMLTNIHLSTAPTNYAALKDGILQPTQFNAGITSLNNSKMCINNTRWILIAALATGDTTGAAGIQIK